jgi:hypothetical protein
VLDRKGDSIHSKRFGIEIIEHLRFDVKRKGGQSGSETLGQVLIKDSPPIKDKKRVRAGVAAALSPFVSEDVPPPITQTPESGPVSVPAETGGDDPS